MRVRSRSRRQASAFQQEQASVNYLNLFRWRAIYRLDGNFIAKR